VAVKESIDLSTATNAGLARRLVAMTYDLLLLVAILMVATLPVVLFFGGVPRGTLAHLLYQIYLLAAIFLFFGWFWVHGGQTLGMRAWRLRVARQDGLALTWRDALVRFLAAIPSLLCAGLGYLWILIDRDRLAWHDRISHTRVLRMPRPES
jgi:uncharacterized RDD family membrane protein YckC